MKKLLTIFIAALMLITFVPTVFAADDTTAPALNGISFNAYEFNRGETITVTVQATELESGFDLTKCFVGFLSYYPNDPDMVLECFSVKLKTLCDGDLQGSFTFNEMVGGTFFLDRIYLCDMNKNDILYCRYDNNLPYNMTFKLTSDYEDPIPEPPLQGPVITGINFSKNTANVGDTVTIMLTADDPSGVASASMDMKPIPSPWYYNGYNILLSPVGGNLGTFTGQFTITPDMPQAEYYPYNIKLVSCAGIESHTVINYSTLNVINPNLIVDVNEPMIVSFSMSSHQLIQGQQVTLSVSIDPVCPEFTHISMNILNKDTGKRLNGFLLKPQGNDIYSGTFYIDPGIRAGNYVIIDVFTFFDGGGGITYISPPLLAETPDGTEYIAGSEFSVLPVLTVSGTDNKSLIKGQPFDATQGVTASNAYTGDISDKMEIIGGSIDTRVPGLYLIKYKVDDTIDIDGVPTPVSYTDYRWIGVSEVEPSVLPGGGDVPLAVTDGSLAIGASSNEVLIKKDGQNIEYSDSYSSPGVYSVNEKSSAQSQSNGSSAMSLSSGLTVTAVIDRSTPELTATWKKEDTSIKVTITANDVSGIAELKYMPGEQALDACKNNGVSFTGSFIVTSSGKYTVYSRDKLGNEGIKVFDLVQTYTVSLNPGTGAKVSPASIKVAYGGNFSTLPTPKRSGYYFEGWYTGKSGTGTLIRSTDIVTGDITLYAKWVKNSSVALKTPSLKVKAPDHKTVTLSWNAVANAEKYIIYKSVGNSGHFTYLITIDDGSLSYTDTNVSAETKYYYKIRANWTPYETIVYSNYSSVKSAKPVWPAMKIKTASVVDHDSITLSWNSIGEAAGYQVLRSTSSKSGYTAIGTSTVNAYTDNTALTGVTYYYEVKAYDSAGLYSDPSGHKSAHTKPDTPANLTLTPSGTTVTVSWDAAGGAVYYEVYRATSLKGSYKRVTTTTNLNFDDIGLTAGKTYFYKVRAYCVVGKSTNVYGFYSDVMSIKI